MLLREIWQRRGKQGIIVGDWKMNILVLSCGTRNKIIQYFKKELNGNGLVIATDSSEYAPALYEADKHFIVPKINDDRYLEVILSICKENQIKAVLSLIDPELSLLAKHRQDFLDIGTVPIISDYEAVELSFNKYKMHKFLNENNFKTVKSYQNKEKFYSDVESGLINYPVFVKPISGSASENTHKALSKEEIEFLFSCNDHLMIQEYMDGIEYGADVYVDMLSGETIAIFAKEKMRMRAGETDKSVSFRDEKLFGQIKDFVQKAGFRGIIDIDLFEVNDQYYISEVNPRFGGGYPHAYECGVNVPKMIVNNVNGIVNDKMVGKYDEGIVMMKYSDVKIIRGS
jgi:carbamoyl-phosphate synthase large subunit